MFVPDTTPEEAEAARARYERYRADRYRDVFRKLDLRVVAEKDGTLELTWRGGQRVLPNVANTVVYAIYNAYRTAERINARRKFR